MRFMGLNRELLFSGLRLVLKILFLLELDRVGSRFLSVDSKGFRAVDSKVFPNIFLLL